MKKVIAALVVVVATVWVVATLTARGAAKVAAGHEWPMGLGRMEDVAQRYENPSTAHPRLVEVRGPASASWEELHREWEVAKSQWQPFAGMAAAALTRRVIDTAKTLPGPAPAWLGELRTIDYRRAHLAAMQVETWEMATAMESYASTGRTFGPYWRLARADWVRMRRNQAWALARGREPETPVWWNRPALMMSGDPNAGWQEILELERDAKSLTR